MCWTILQQPRASRQQCAVFVVFCLHHVEKSVLSPVPAYCVSPSGQASDLSGRVRWRQFSAVPTLTSIRTTDMYVLISRQHDDVSATVCCAWCRFRSMLRIALARACRAAVCPSIEITACGATASGSLLAEATRASTLSQKLLVETSSPALLSRVQFAFPPAAVGAHRWRTGVSTIHYTATIACKPIA